MSPEATGWVWKHSPYRGAELLVHLAIGDVVNDMHNNEFWMSTGALAKKAKCSRSTATATLADMLRRGLLIMVESGAAQRRPSTYRFRMPSAVVGLASPLTGSASAISDDPLARSPDTELNRDNQRTQAEFSTGAGRARKMVERCSHCNRISFDCECNVIRMAGA